MGHHTTQQIFCFCSLDLIAQSTKLTLLESSQRSKSFTTIAPSSSTLFAASSQQYFSPTPNQHQSAATNQPAVLFSHKKSAPANSTANRVKDDANDDEEISITKRQSHHGTNYSNPRLDPTLGLETIQATS